MVAVIWTGMHKWMRLIARFQQDHAKISVFANKIWPGSSIPIG